MSEYEAYDSADDFGLTQFDDDFDSVEPSEFDEVPDGKYQARVESVKLESSSKGDPMLKWDLIVLNGPQAGRHVFKNSVITQASLPIVKKELTVMGLGLARFSDLSGRLDELLDVTLEITKRTNGEYTNVYFNRRIQLAAHPAMETTDGERPF